MYRLLASLLFATSLPAMAQIYVYTDSSGNTAYTNEKPPAGVSYQVMDLPPTNTIDAPVAPAAQPDANYIPPPAPNYQQPENLTIIHDNPASYDNGDDGSDDGSDDVQYYGPDYDYDRARAAGVDAAVPGPGAIAAPPGVGGPVGDAMVPGPGSIAAPPGVGGPAEEGDRMGEGRR